MSQDIGSRISTHSNAANRIRIGPETSILCVRGAPSAGNAMLTSHLEDLRVPRLDLFAHLLDTGGIVLPQLDLVEPAHPRLLLGQRMDGVLAGKIDQQLLRLKRVQPVLEQARRIRIRRRREYRARSG